MPHRMLSTAGRALTTLLLALLAAGIASGAPAVAEPLPPDKDPFYSYNGSTPLAKIAPGTVLKTRTVQATLGPIPTPLTASQLLYRTTGQRGQPTVTVTTVLQPTPVPVVPRIVEYLSFYDGLGAKCNPSYTLAGGDPGEENSSQAVEEGLLIYWFLEQGYTVTVPDFEGIELAWMAGRESGYGALDAVRATEQHLGVGASTKVALTGYSGGAVAANWASELAPAYAPELRIVGVAEGGLPVHYPHMFDYISGTDFFSAAIPGMLIGLARAYDVNLKKYLSSYGRRVVREQQDVCIAESFGDYPGLTVEKLMKPKYRDITQIPIFVRMLNEQIMGTAPGHPEVPLLMAVGNSDGRGDGAMVAGDVEALAHQYCDQGVAVTYREYQGASHVTAAAFFEPETGAFLQARFAGVPATDNCASVGRGNSLAPLPMPRDAPRPAPAPDGDDNPGDEDDVSPGSLAATGASPALAVTAGLLLVGALLVRDAKARLRRNPRAWMQQGD